MNEAILCDVAVERQVEITGPDAARFTQLLTCRDLSTMQVGQCKYILITNAEGGLLNDPVLLRLAEITSGSRSPTATSSCGRRVLPPTPAWTSRSVNPMCHRCNSGPKSGEIMTALFGDWIEELAYYWLRETELDGIPLVVSRTGWSSELGYEIYLRDGSRGDDLWEKIMAVGAPLGLKPGHTSSIRRIEGAMLSYHADATIDTNPFELGLDRLVAVDSAVDFIGKDALRRIRDEGVTRKQAGIVIEMEPLTGPNTTFWPITAGGERVGEVTSAVWSPASHRTSPSPWCASTPPTWAPR